MKGLNVTIFSDFYLKIIGFKLIFFKIRANIWALKDVGCTHIIVSTATGSLKKEIKPGDLVILDDFIDRTYKREQTFYDGKEGSPKGKI